MTLIRCFVYKMRKLIFAYTKDNKEYFFIKQKHFIRLKSGKQNHKKQFKKKKKGYAIKLNNCRDCKIAACKTVGFNFQSYISTKICYFFSVFFKYL